ncbi:oxygenase MpaB family protein [Mycolicibacterium hippocampi]|uniref:oxygenase MpaB family protein n=1 Tax=Mycolicibacterium hippocampi TaxID=659824 RepID=UPI003517C05B
MHPLRSRIVDDFERQAGRHDDAAIYGGPSGDPGLIGPGSMSWELHADLAAVSQAGLAAIVLEVLHPSVVAGVEDLSDFRDDPFRRARATLGYVLATTFGNTAAATALIERVRHIHSFVNGTRPDGVPYRALDPELITWVHVCIPWMIMRTFERTNRVLSADERDRYLAEQATIGRLGGGQDVPASVAELERFVARLRPKLAVTAQTRAFLDFLIASPLLSELPGPIQRRVGRFAVHAGMIRAPRWARELTGQDRPAALSHTLYEPALQLDARMHRWAFGTPRYVLLARARAAGAPAPEVLTR